MKNNVSNYIYIYIYIYIHTYTHTHTHIRMETFWKIVDYSELVTYT